jgi:hypothetical protein
LQATTDSAPWFVDHLVRNELFFLEADGAGVGANGAAGGGGATTGGDGSGTGGAAGGSLAAGPPGPRPPERALRRLPVAPPDSCSRLVREIVSRVHANCGYRPGRVLLAHPGTIAKTSSGKIQRSRLRQMLQADEFGEPIIYQSGARS